MAATSATTATASEDKEPNQMEKKTAPGDQITFEAKPIRGYPELHWAGKRPFNGTQHYPAQLKETYGAEENGWRNKIYWGDNLQVMSHLLREHRGKVKLIYIDPPYDSKADYKARIRLRGMTVETEKNAFEEKQYADIWVNDEYLQFMFERFILLKELLDKDGALFVHCDWHQSHRLRCILDEVFGPARFRNEIVWHYYNKMQGNIGRLASNHDTILFYSKGESFTFNKLQEKRPEPINQIKRIWDKATQSLVNAKDASGHVVYVESTHKTLDDVWRMSMLQPADRTELTSYPTQKPEALVERIIRSATKAGDLVFDCFMGSGTTQAVALKTGRRFLGADINLGAITIATKRLLEIAREIDRGEVPVIRNGLGPDGVEDDEKPTAFYTGLEIYNVNHYDLFRNPIDAKNLIAGALDIQPLTGNVFDGEKDGRKVKIMPVERIATRADLNELISNLPYKEFSKRAKENPPGRPVEHITLVCMGHEPDLKAHLQNEVKYHLDIEVLDILRDKANLEFKRDAEAHVVIKDGKLVIERFYPMNLLQKLSLMKKDLADWRELVDSVKIDFNYDGAILNPTVVDIPEGKDELVKGTYPVPDGAGTIRVKITDLLSESLEVEV